MKMLIAALTLATLISGPAFTQPTAAASNGGRGANQSGQNYNGYYRGYPLEEWYRIDGR